MQQLNGGHKGTQVSFCKQLFNHPGRRPSHTQAQETSHGQATALYTSASPVLTKPDILLHVSHQLYPLAPGKNTLSDRPRGQEYQEEPIEASQP